MQQAIHQPTGESLYVVRRGTNNTRVNRVDNREGSWLVPTAELVWKEDGEGGSPERVIPLTSLRRLYRHERRSGSKEERFNRLTRLGSHCGVSSHEFLADAIDRSVDYFSRYSNGEVFVDDRDADVDVDPDVPAEAAHFAMLLVQHLANGKFRIEPSAERGITAEKAAGLDFKFVEYEMSPIRTTRSCYDDGRSARNSGTGGMDALLSLSKGGRPIVTEIKAQTESVGPTFALIQSLMYGVEIMTPSQQSRLTQSYPEAFDLRAEVPQPVDIYLMFEKQKPVPDLYERDFTFMAEVAGSLCQHETVRGRIGRVVAFECSVDDDGLLLEVAFRAGG